MMTICRLTGSHVATRLLWHASFIIPWHQLIETRCRLGRFFQLVSLLYRSWSKDRQAERRPADIKVDRDITSPIWCRGLDTKKQLNHRIEALEMWTFKTIITSYKKTHTQVLEILNMKINLMQDKNTTDKSDIRLALSDCQPSMDFATCALALLLVRPDQ